MYATVPPLSPLVCFPRSPPVVWVVGLFRVWVYRYDMKGFKVEGQQLGAAQSETAAHPGECLHFGHATKLHSFKSHNIHEDPRFGVPSL